MIRLIQTYTFLCAISLFSMSYAVTPGDLILTSPINEPLKAQFQLNNVEQIPLDQIFFSSASWLDYKILDLTPPSFANDLNFSRPKRNSQKVLTIQLTTSQPIEKDNIPIVISIDWPQGRILRQYTLRFERPLFTRNQSIKTINPSTITKDDTEQLTYIVKSGDSLWKIANQLRSNSGLTTAQMVLKLAELNQANFKNNNINFLKPGDILRIPRAPKNPNSPKYPTDSSPNKAITAPTQDGRPKSIEPSKNRSTVAKDQLRLVTPTDNATTAKISQNSQSNIEINKKQLNNSLNLVKETLDSKKRQAQDIAENLKSLNEQIQTIEKLLLLKDQQFAALQNRFKEQATLQTTAFENISNSRNLTDYLSIPTYYWNSWAEDLQKPISLQQLKTNQKYLISIDLSAIKYNDDDIWYEPISENLQNMFSRIVAQVNTTIEIKPSFILDRNFLKSSTTVEKSIIFDFKEMEEFDNKNKSIKTVFNRLEVANNSSTMNYRFNTLKLPITTNSFPGKSQIIISLENNSQLIDTIRIPITIIK